MLLLPPEPSIIPSPISPIMDSNNSQNPLDDQVTSSSNQPDEGGGGDGGGGGKLSVAAVSEVPDPEPVEEGLGHGLEPDLDSRVADVAGEDGGRPETKAAEKEKIRRKRGRASRASLEKVKSVLNPPKKREKKDEEDVCFICFDGGELVVCDRRGCPKAYHPACIKRNQSFFRSKAKWNCGWHICTSCQKTAHYMCYTCPHSLCKLCCRKADFVLIRETKGLCATCRGTIMLIENVERGNMDMVNVDFDDKSNWEYLFKAYWVDLKAKLSLTVDEITKAKSLRKERKVRCRRANEKLSNGYAKSDVRSSSSQRSSYLCESTGWVSNELLEFVRYMKGGDMSALSRFEVQALLLEYVDRNGLRVPDQKWEISCDVRLGKLFGKASVDHFEMLKLLDSHFLVKEIPQLNGVVRGTNFDVGGGQMDIDLNKADQPVVCNDKMLESCENLDAKDNHIDQDDCAVMDSQRISSIYLRRILIENLIDDVEQFQRKVVGSIVRKRIFGKDQKQDMHKLVQVVGTSKAIELYKVGDKYTNVKLVILNFDREDVISIDEISDHDFTEEECRQFNQSIRSGRVKWFNKGELQQKALSVKAEQVNDESSYHQPVMVNEPILDNKREVSRMDSWITSKCHFDAISSVTKEALSGTGSKISPSPLSTGTEQSVNDDETYKMWHYQDSNGKVQGPFTMVQMRKWRTVGHFPHDQRIWRMDQKHEDSVLLTDALDGHFHKGSPALHSQEEVRHTSDDRDSSLDGVSSISVNTNGTRGELGSYSSSHTIKTETENMEKECRYFSGQLAGTLLGTIGLNEGFDHSKGISIHHQMGLGQSSDASTGKLCNGDGYSSTTLSSGPNWKAPSPDVSWTSEHLKAGSFVNSLLATPHQSKGIEIAFPAPPGTAQKPAFENFRSPNVCIENLAPSWTTPSSLVDGGLTVNKAISRDCDSNLVSAASEKLTELCSMDGSTLTLGSAQLMPSSTAPTPFSWQALVLEPVEFTPLPEESVSDLLAELEASEPLNTSFPSPSPKNSDGSRGKNDCHSQEPGFFSVSHLGSVDSVSSSCNFTVPSPAVANEPHWPCYFNPPQNTQRMILQENSSSITHLYMNGYPEHGQVSWISTLERNPEMWEKQHQQQTAQYYGVNRNSSPRDQLVGGLNLDVGRGSSIWDRQ